MIFLVFNILCRNELTNIKVFSSNNKEYFVNYIFLSTGMSLNHIAKSSYILNKVLKKYYKNNCVISGISSNWIIVDYNGVLIHLMLESSRNYYNLDTFYFDFCREIKMC